MTSTPSSPNRQSGRKRRVPENYSSDAIYSKKSRRTRHSESQSSDPASLSPFLPNLSSSQESQPSQHDYIAELLGLEVPVAWKNSETTIRFIVGDMDLDNLLVKQHYTVPQLPTATHQMLQLVYGGVLHYIGLLQHSPMYSKFLQLFHFLPILLLSLPPALPHNAISARIRKNCDWFLSGKLAALYQRSLRFAQKTAPVRQLDAVAAKEHATKRADVCALAGNLSKALDILLRPIADHDCDHFEALQALHPTREQPINTHPDRIRELLNDPSINWNE